MLPYTQQRGWMQPVSGAKRGGGVTSRVLAWKTKDLSCYGYASA
jgi:hypothetical protein